MPDRPLRVLMEYSSDWAALSGQQPQHFREAIRALMREAFEAGWEARQINRYGGDQARACADYALHESKLSLSELVAAYEPSSSVE
jgi:hypothetical protein